MNSIIFILVANIIFSIHSIPDDSNANSPPQVPTIKKTAQKAHQEIKTMQHGQEVPDVYIITLAPDADLEYEIDRIRKETGGRILNVYETLPGFAIEVPSGTAEANFFQHQSVIDVEADLILKPLGAEGSEKADAAGEGAHAAGSQHFPNGINRIETDLSETAKINGIDDPMKVNIAIIDTGVDPNHPDLNVVYSRSFINGVREGHDDHGHGTHVAGIAAARDNGFGVVGVAPGANIYSLKVLNDSAWGYLSDIIDAVDWVARESRTPYSSRSRSRAERNYNRYMERYERYMERAERYSDRVKRYQDRAEQYKKMAEENKWTYEQPSNREVRRLRRYHERYMRRYERYLKRAERYVSRVDSYKQKAEEYKKTAEENKWTLDRSIERTIRKYKRYHKRYISRYERYQERAERYLSRVNDYKKRAEEYRNRAKQYPEGSSRYRSYTRRSESYLHRSERYASRVASYKERAESYKAKAEEYLSKAEERAQNPKMVLSRTYKRYIKRSESYLGRAARYASRIQRYTSRAEEYKNKAKDYQRQADELDTEEPKKVLSRTYKRYISRYERYQSRANRYLTRVEDYSDRAEKYKKRAEEYLDEIDREGARNPDKIDVVNMSIGALGENRALQRAIQNAVERGVVVVVSAGNGGRDIFGPDGRLFTSDDIIPAAYPEVVTVSAMADSDGEGGGKGRTIAFGTPDDTMPLFSNHSIHSNSETPVSLTGGSIDLAAPGVEILSTWIGGGYRVLHGTSMSAPHAAGAFALLIAKLGQDVNADGRIDEDDVTILRQLVIETSQPQRDWRPGSTRDRDSLHEGLLQVGSF